MKKNLKLFLLAFILVPFFTACSDDDEPNDLILAKSALQMEIDAVETVAITSGNGKYEALSTEPLVATATIIDNQVVKITAVGNGETTITVSDKEKKSAIIRVTVGTTTEALSTAKDFAWERKGGNNATGLSEFGLAWESNTGSVAIIKQNSAAKFVKLNASDWTSITTKEELFTAIEAAEEITEYRGVSVTASKGYDDVLAVKLGESCRLIHVTKGDVNSSTSGTTVTVSGQYKD